MDLVSLIEKSYSKEEAERHILFKPGKQEQTAISGQGMEILKNLPHVPGACTAMSAVWTAFLRDRLNMPAYCVAGDLIVGGEVIWGGGTHQDVAGAFQGVNMDWNGHCWVGVGDLICDISIFRTAYSQKSPPVLKQFIVKEFGEGRGLFIATRESIAGLQYVPKHVLTETELTGVIQGFMEFLKKKRS